MRFFNIKKTNIILVCSLIALGSTSCIMDTFEQDETPARVLPKGKYIVGFTFNQLEPSTGTRADDKFIDGEHYEHAIGSEGNFIVYFDKDEKVVEVSELFGSHEEYPELERLEGSYFSTFDVEEDYKAPEYCMAILNAGSFTGNIYESVGKTKDELLEKLIWSASDPTKIGFDSQGRFTMTNTVYCSGSTQHDLFKIPDEVVQDAREPFDPNKVILAKVERLVAKFSLQTASNDRVQEDTYNYSGADIGKAGKIFLPKPKDEELILFTGFDADGVPQYDVRKWRVKATGWGMNALAKEEYLFRKTEDKEYYPGWNGQGEDRAFWSIDLNYDDPTIYPWQYRHAINAPKMTNYEDNSENDRNVLVNYSYNDFVQATKGATTDEKSGFDRVVYTPENTYDRNKMSVEKEISDYLGRIIPSEVAGKIEALDKRTDVLAGTHLIFTAQLLTDLDDDGNFNIEEHLYRDRASMFYDDERRCFNKLITTFNYDLQSQFVMRYHYYDWDGQTNTDTPSGTQLLIMPEGMYSLYYHAQQDGKEYKLTLDQLEDHDGNPGAAVKAMENDGHKYFIKGEVEDGDGKVIVNPENFSIRSSDDSSQEAKFKVYRYEEYQKKIENPEYVMRSVRDATLNDLKSLIYEWTGPVDHFNRGRMYYFKPVGIFEIEKDDNKQPVYFCGTVRNAWYQYVLTGINQIGTSVDNPDQPIVPLTVPVNSQIELNIKILDWHNVNANVNGIQ